MLMLKWAAAASAPLNSTRARPKMSEHVPIRVYHAKYANSNKRYYMENRLAIKLQHLSASGRVI